MTVREQFPRRKFVHLAEGGYGIVKATTEKFGGRVLVAWDFDVEVGEAWKDATSLRLVEDSERILTCDGSCGGTGVYRGGGTVVNGVYQGFSGPCYRCEGHGKQTPKDRRRNRHYDNHYRRIYL